MKMIPLESIDVMIDCIYLYLLVLNHLHNIKYLQQKQVSLTESKSNSKVHQEIETDKTSKVYIFIYFSSMVG